MLCPTDEKYLYISQTFLEYIIGLIIFAFSERCTLDKIDKSMINIKKYNIIENMRFAQHYYLAHYKQLVDNSGSYFLSDVDNRSDDIVSSLDHIIVLQLRQKPCGFSTDANTKKNVLKLLNRLGNKKILVTQHYVIKAGPNQFFSKSQISNGIMANVAINTPETYKIDFDEMQNEICTPKNAQIIKNKLAEKIRIFLATANKNKNYILKGTNCSLGQCMAFIKNNDQLDTIITKVVDDVLKMKTKKVKANDAFIIQEYIRTKIELPGNAPFRVSIKELGQILGENVADTTKYNDVKSLFDQTDISGYNDYIDFKKLPYKIRLYVIVVMEKFSTGTLNMYAGFYKYYPYEFLLPIKFKSATLKIGKDEPNLRNRFISNNVGDNIGKILNNDSNEKLRNNSAGSLQKYFNNKIDLLLNLCYTHKYNEYCNLLRAFISGCYDNMKDKMIYTENTNNIMITFFGVDAFIQNDVVKIIDVNNMCATYDSNIDNFLAELSSLDNVGSIGKKLEENLHKVYTELNYHGQQKNILFQLIEQGNIDQLEKYITPQNINQVDSDGYTPLMRAIKQDTINIVNLLLKKGARTDIQSEDKNVFTLAIDNTNMDILNSLLDSRADINLKNSNGATPLIYTTEHSLQSVHSPLSYYIIRIFLQRGADVSILDNNGKSAYDYAVTFYDSDSPTLKALQVGGASFNYYQKYMKYKIKYNMLKM